MSRTNEGNEFSQAVKPETLAETGLAKLAVEASAQVEAIEVDRAKLEQQIIADRERIAFAAANPKAAMKMRLSRRS